MNDAEGPRSWSTKYERDAKLLRVAFDDSSIGIGLIESPGAGQAEHLVEVNDALCSILGYSREEMLKSGIKVLSLADWPDATEALRTTGAGGRRIEYEMPFERGDGRRIWLLLTLSPAGDTGAGETRHRIVQVQDISERREFEAKLSFLAEHDQLTGLVSHQRLIEIVETALAYARESGGTCALAFFDLDHFKSVNDVYGHLLGDEALRAFAAVLRDAIRDADTAARLGGDEFVVFMPGFDVGRAKAFANDVLALLRERPFESVPQGEKPIAWRASAGVSELYGRDQVSGDDLLSEADSALHIAKRGGRDRVVEWQPSTNQAAQGLKGSTWARKIRRALDEEALFLYGQPIRDLESGKIRDHEALLRMHDPDQGLVYPPNFLYTAERFGLAVEIDRWVLNQAVSSLARSDPEQRLSINITRASLDEHNGLLDLLASRLRESGVDPSRLSIELDESTCVGNLETAINFSNGLHGVGCRLSLDDYGAAFGSVYYLKTLPIDTLKIDGQFIRSLVDSKADRLIVRAIVSMAEGFGQDTVAEFVVDERIEALLRDLGVDYAQGSSVGPTVPLEEALGIA